MNKTAKPNNYILYAVCLLSAAGLLAICSKSSPLYPLNDWPDINCFYTLGKGMIHGKMPYVDLLEQKGPYIYAMAALSYMMDGHGFGGYFLFEVLGMYLFLLYAYKLSALYCRNTQLWMLPLLGMAVTTAKSFVHGGSWEQLSLGILAYAAYSLLAFLKHPGSPLGARTLVLNGLLAGVLLWSKFSLLGLYIAWVLVVAVFYLHRREWRALGRAVLLFGGGMAAATLPWLVYFGLGGALKTWLKVYLYDNIFLYGVNSPGSGQSTGLGARCMSTLQNIWSSAADRGNLGYSLPGALGVCFFLLTPRNRVSTGEKLAVCLMGMGLASGIFIGSTRHDYYGLPLALFAAWGLWLGSSAINRLHGSEKKKVPTEKKRISVLWWSAALLCALFISLQVSPNTYLLLTDKADLPQYRFARQILASEDPSLLNYLFLDGGFYTVTGQVPTEKTFCLLNMDRAARIREQQEYVRQQRTHWVVTWRAQETSEEELRHMDLLSEYYDLVDYMYFYFEGDNRTYALYEKK